MRGDWLGGVGGGHASQPAVLLRKVAGLVNRYERWDLLALTQLEVLGTTARSNVHDAGALVVRDHVPGNDAMSNLGLGRKLVERSDIRSAHQLGTKRGASDIGTFSKQILDARGHHPVDTE